MLNVGIWLLVGAVIGGFANWLMRDGDDTGVFVNVLVGIVAALLASRFVAPRIGLRLADPRLFSIEALAVALIGALVFLVVATLIRRLR